MKILSQMRQVFSCFLHLAFNEFNCFSLISTHSCFSIFIMHQRIVVHYITIQHIRQHDRHSCTKVIGTNKQPIFCIPNLLVKTKANGINYRFLITLNKNRPENDPPWVPGSFVPNTVFPIQTLSLDLHRGKCLRMWQLPRKNRPIHNHDDW